MNYNSFRLNIILCKEIDLFYTKRKFVLKVKRNKILQRNLQVQIHFQPFTKRSAPYV